jgi:hypothetical protein
VDTSHCGIAAQTGPRQVESALRGGQTLATWNGNNARYCLNEPTPQRRI